MWMGGICLGVCVDGWTCLGVCVDGWNMSRCVCVWMGATCHVCVTMNRPQYM